jgi:hypothetical protein
MHYALIPFRICAVLTREDEKFLQAELDRSILELRSTLSLLAKEHRLPTQLMAISNLIDRVECHLTTEDGESAFELSDDEQTVRFRASVVRTIIESTTLLACEIGIDAEASLRVPQTAINLFLIHELLHVRQNFPHFATVTTIKDGIEGIGLPLLDLAADTLSAWICAHIECHKTGEKTDDEILANYVNCLVLAYVIGAFVYDSATKPEKRQRAIGLIISAVLVQAQKESKLNRETIFDNWQPTSPLFALNIEKSKSFNAMVIAEFPGLLLHDDASPDPKKVDIVWNHVGKRPILQLLKTVSEILVELRVINR